MCFVPEIIIENKSGTPSASSMNDFGTQRATVDVLAD